MYFFHLLKYDYYLYSPKIYISNSRHFNVLLLCFSQLLLIPYLSTWYLYILFCLCFISISIVHVPPRIRVIIYKFTSILFLVFIINIFTVTKQSKKYISVPYLVNLFAIKPFIHLSSYLSVVGIIPPVLFSISIYIPISTVRFIIISFNHFCIVKLTLLIVPYELISYYFCLVFKFLRSYSYKKIAFTTNLCNQLLKIFTNKIDKMEIAYCMRGTVYESKISYLNRLHLFYLLIKNFVDNLCSNINYITNSLYARDISYKIIYYLQMELIDY
uniref:Uncharacterized protein n=1 Tax=Neogoniolithon spectabile TaxID=231755 RepID=A0A3G3MGX2_9FLOR|nr:hypothetical protein [Neogoniolithon spectabile]AYR06086.1 hypothetical protein [Neogoniolithon spectabile]